MANRLDALMTREYETGGEKKTAYSKIGVAFETRNGGWSVKLDAMPAPVDGQYSFVLMPPRENTQQSAPQRQGRPAASHAPAFDPDGDAIPFHCQWQ